MIQIERADSPDEGIELALNGNIGISYFWGQSHLYLTDGLYKGILGRKVFSRIAKEVFGEEFSRMEHYLDYAGGNIRDHYRSVVKNPGIKVCQIVLPSVLVVGAEIPDPDGKLIKLAELINKQVNLVTLTQVLRTIKENKRSSQASK